MNELPQELATLWDEIMSKVEPYVDLELKYTPNVLPVDTSKVGGLPFLPIGTPYPQDADGNYLFLLAQINFAELPHLEGYPKEGLLQWYISPCDEQYGCTFGIHNEETLNQKNFRIHYWSFEDLKKECITDFDFLIEQWQPKLDQFMVPISPPHANFSITGTLRKMTMYEFFYQRLNIDTFQPKDLLAFKAILEKHHIWSDFLMKNFTGSEHLKDKAYKEYSLYLKENNLLIDLGKHRIGGSADFSQGDPRDDFMVDSVQLLQFDWHIEPDKEYGEVRLEFTDSGLAHLFIEPKDLARLDFSRVFYTWDCC